MDTVQTAVWLEGDDVCTRLLVRKNRPNGSGIMRRSCTCGGSAGDSRLVCPLHMLWQKYFAKLPKGTRPWLHVSAGSALSSLRGALAAIAVPDSALYWTHDLRRGHAEVCGFHVKHCWHLLALLLSPGYATEWLVISPNSGGWPMAVGSFHDLYGRSQTSEGSCFILSILEKCMSLHAKGCCICCCT